jgi:plastocyanin
MFTFTTVKQGSKEMTKKSPKSYTVFLLCNLLFLFSLIVEAKRPEYHLDLKNHLFYPAQITIPANKKVKLVIHNRDNSAEEFSSFDLNREKVIFSKNKSTIFVGPLPAGEYSFFGEYHPNSARGKVVVEKISNADVPHDAFSSKQGTQNVN